MNTMKTHTRGVARGIHTGAGFTQPWFFSTTLLCEAANQAPDLFDWISPIRSLRNAQDRVGQECLRRSIFPSQSTKRFRIRLSVAHQSRRFAVVYPPLSRGVLGFSPPPVWLTESVPATAPKDFDAGNAAWFFSRDWPRWRGTPTANGKPGNPIGASPRRDVTLLSPSA